MQSRSKRTTVNRSKRNLINRSKRNRAFVRKSLVEKKHFDTYWHTIGNTLPLFHLAVYGTEIEGDTTGSGYGFVGINFPIQGNGPNQHIGNKYLIEGIEMRFVSYIHGAEDCVNSVRICLIHDKAPNGSAPDLIQIFRDLGSSGNTRFLSHPNPSYTERFKVIYDKICDLDSDANSQKTVTVNLRSNIKVQVIGSNGAISDISTGAIYLIAGTEVFPSYTEGAISASSYSTRITYTDY